MLFEKNAERFKNFNYAMFCPSDSRTENLTHTREYVFEKILKSLTNMAMKSIVAGTLCVFSEGDEPFPVSSMNLFLLHA